MGGVHDAAREELGRFAIAVTAFPAVWDLARSQPDQKDAPDGVLKDKQKARTTAASR